MEILLLDYGFGFFSNLGSKPANDLAVLTELLIAQLVVSGAELHLISLDLRRPEYWRPIGVDDSALGRRIQTLVQLQLRRQFKCPNTAEVIVVDRDDSCPELFVPLAASFGNLRLVRRWLILRWLLTLF